MNGKILAGALAALTWGGVALAQEELPEEFLGEQPVDEQPVGEQPVGEEARGPDIIVIQPVDPLVQQQPGLGGSGAAGLEARQGEVLLRCQPLTAGPATGGSGLMEPEPFEHGRMLERDEEGRGGAGLAEPLEEQRRANMRGLTVLVGGGIEGYTNALAPQINPGPAVSVVASIKPSSVLGLELGYNGAFNNLDVGAAGGATNGPDIIRNGAHAAATFGLSATPVQPYLMAGLGVSRYNVRGGFAQGFDDDVVGHVPVGAGLRTHLGNFTAGARLQYNFLFDQEFAANVPEAGINAPGGSDFSEGGSYIGTVNLGLTF